MVGFHFFNFYVCIVSMLFFAVLKVFEKWGDKRTMPPMLQPVRVAAKIFVFVILVNFRELFISCFARFSLNVAKHEIKFWVIICDISHKKKSNWVKIIVIWHYMNQILVVLQLLITVFWDLNIPHIFLFFTSSQIFA